MNAAISAASALPPAGLPGLDPAWSRLVRTVDPDGASRTWHVLDSGGGADAGPSTGTRGTLLCVHGNPTWSYLWRRLVASPPEGWRVVAPDQLDMGWSERTGTVRRLATRIDDLGRLTDAMGIEGPVVTVAHDWGGPVSLGWALGHRDQLAGVVLANTAVHQPPEAAAPSIIRAARARPVLHTATTLTPAFVRGTTSLAWPRPPRHVRDAYASPYRSADRRRAVETFVADIPLEAGHPSAAALDALAAAVADLDVPVLLAWGPADPVFSDLYLRDLVARLPHADVHRYEGAGHLVVEDAPAMLDDVAAWVDVRVGRPRRNAVAGEGPVTAPAPEARRPLWQALEEREGDPSTALVELGRTERRVSFARLWQVVRDLAAGLASHSVRRGDRVALLVPPGADLTAAVYACWRLGAVIVVADAGLGARGLARALRGSWPDHVIAVPRGLAAARALRIPGRRIAAGPVSGRAARTLGADVTVAALVRAGAGRPLPEPPGPDDEAAVVFTSGATGPAKGVVYRHAALELQRDALVSLFGVGPDDRLVAAFAPFAMYGPAMGIPSVVPDVDVTRPAGLTATALADAAAAVDGTLVWASPAALRNAVDTAGALDPDRRASLARIRTVMSAGAPVPADLLRAVGDVMPHAERHTPYGMTEVLPVADITFEGIEAAGEGDGVCVGLPVTGVEIAVARVNPDGSTAHEPTREPGVLGEVCVRAPWSKARYDRLWATEHASSRNRGWHRTGDVGHLDDAGRLWIGGRLAHVVTSPAGPIAPVGVEQRVERVPGVERAACVGVGPAGTQAVVVVVTTKPPRRRAGSADAELREAVRTAAAPVGVAAVLVRPSLPVDVRHNAKIDRSALASWAAAVLAGRGRSTGAVQ